MTRQDNEVAAGAIVEDRAWLEKLHSELRGLLAPVFAQARSRFTAFAYIGALLAERGDRKSCWQLAEAAGHATPRRMQALLAGHAWDWTAALAALQRFIAAHLGDPEAIVVLDETAELKKGDRTVGVARQHAGITGQVENCQTVVFAACVTARAHALFGFRLYLPKPWCQDGKRREQAHVPDETEFTTKPALGTAMLTSAANAGVPFAWAAADEVYGRSSKLREACEKAGKGYVLAVPVNFQVRLPSGRKAAVSAVAAMVPATAWGLVRARLQGPPRLRLGLGRHVLAAALGADPPQPVRPVGPGVLLLPRAAGPAGIPAPPDPGRRKRWPVEECLQQGKGQAGLDQHQVRTWQSFHRHTVLSMWAQALLAIAAARPVPPARTGDDQPAVGDGQPAAWRDTGKLPATAGDRPPGDDPGLVKVSVPEARHLARLATAPVSRAARDLGYAWSRWRRRHQARARWHHYHARLKAARVT